MAGAEDTPLQEELARLLAQVAALRQRGGRGAGAAHPIDTADYGDSLQPLCAALNDLLGEVGQIQASERKLRSLTNSLERRVRERTRAQEAATAEANRANKAKTRFLAAAVHDLSQPITAARMYVSLLKGDLEGDPRWELAANADSALGSIEGLFSGLLDLARFESGKLQADISTVDMNTMFATLEKEFAVMARGQGVRVTFVPTGSAVRSDQALLYRVLQNFVSNALRYTRRGRVLVGVRRAGVRRRIEVWDTGPGIPPARIDDIFDEFQRLDATASERGTGLGLSIVKSIAQALGHEVGVKSWPGEGSMFYITVPAVGAGARPAAPPSAPGRPAASLRGLRVWLVDDHAEVRDGTQRALRHWGCRSRAFASAGAAVSAAKRTGPPAVLLVDYRIGRDTGLELLARLDAVWGQRVPALLITGESSGELPPQRRARVLAKPLRPEALRQALVDLYPAAG